MYENDLYSDGNNTAENSQVFGNQGSITEQSTVQEPMHVEENYERAQQYTQQTAANETAYSSSRYFDNVRGVDDAGANNGGNGMGPIPQEPVKKPRKERKSGGFFRKAAAAVALAVIFGAVAGGTFYGICKVTGVMDRIAVGTTNVAPGGSQSTDIVKPEEDSEIKYVNTDNIQVVTNDISEVVEEVVPAMVTIQKTSIQTEEYFWGWGQSYSREVQSSGSGIIVGENDSELLIVTNHHVAENPQTLEVTFIDGTTVAAKIKGMDSEMDLAVLAVSLSDLEQETKDKIVIARLGDSESLKLGQPAIVIGNALGIGISVTDGIISGLEREMTTENGNTGTFIQTSAAVNHGNSGGALLNINGEVIGIVSNKIDGESVEAMGYAIPISAANPIISDLMERRTRDEKVSEEEMGYLGVSLQEVTSDAKLFYNMPDGIYVYEVMKDSGAEKAGIIRGDIITRLEGEKVGSYNDLRSILEYYKVGDEVKVTISRQEAGEYVSHELTVTLGEKQQ